MNNLFTKVIISFFFIPLIYILPPNIFPFVGVTDAFAWSNSGGDHAGANWNVTTNTSISGVHTNIGDMTIAQGIAVTLAGETELNINGTLTLDDNGSGGNGAIMYIDSSNNNAQVGGQWVGRGSVINANNVVIDQGSKIDGDARGYMPGGSNWTSGKGPGGGLYLGNSGGMGGAGSGGKGGDGIWTNGNPTGGAGIPYGYSDTPIEIGSSGAMFYAAGGRGGSAIKLVITDTALINGIITMNGGEGSKGSYRGGAAGGSGGSIWITTNVLAGAGNIFSKGADGDTLDIYGYFGGGGGGGRIAVHYLQNQSSIVLSENVNTEGGWGYVDNAGNGSVSYKTVSDPHLFASAFHSQLKTSGEPIGIGGTTDINSIVLGVWTDPTSRVTTNTLQVEIKPTSQSFNGTNLLSSSATTTSITIPTLVSVTATNLSSGSYHWRARLLDANGVEIKKWMNFPYSPSNNETVADFIIGSSYSDTENYPDFTIDRTWSFASPANTGTYYFNNFTVKDGVSLTIAGNTVLNLKGNLHVKDTSIMYIDSSNNNARVNGQWVGKGVTINANNITIDQGAKIDGDSRGYIPVYGNWTGGNGPGGGQYTGGGMGGAGHGGNGGGVGFGSSYGVAEAPIEPGSAGAMFYAAGGNGGSAIKLVVTNTILINGSVTMNGGDGTKPGSYRGGSSGGSGGSIWIITNTLSGNGNILAQGGDADTVDIYGLYGGGGAGGRIAISYVRNYRTNLLSEGNNTSKGWGTNNNANNGTVRMEQKPLHGAINVPVNNIYVGLAEDESIDMSLEENKQETTETVRLRLLNRVKVVELEHDFSASDLDLASVTIASDPTENKSVVANLTETHSLYIPKESYHNAVVICPNAMTLDDVTPGCTNADYKYESDPDVSVVYIDGLIYWKVDGLTGTGGISIFDTSNVSDTMSRLQQGEDSNHMVVFGTVNGLLLETDELEIKFQSGFDLTGVTYSDIDLRSGGRELTLAGTATTNTWGVVVDNVTNNTITFTPPTTGSSTGYVLGGEMIEIQVGTNATSGVNQVTNPDIVAEYEIGIKITNTEGIETGEVTVPVVDDDTVNISGYLDTTLTFDIDTTTETGNTVGTGDCDTAGGANPCDSYEGAGDNLGYVISVGEMTTNSVNKSHQTTVTHADGNTGVINSIFFDLETNAQGGAVVTVLSRYGGMYLDPSNILTSGLATPSTEIEVTEGSGRYGIQSVNGTHYRGSNVGTINIAANCDGELNGGGGTLGDYYCGVTSLESTEIFNTGTNPVEEARIEFGVGVAPSSTNATGTYEDYLTFIATGTF